MATEPEPARPTRTTSEKAGAPKAPTKRSASGAARVRVGAAAGSPSAMPRGGAGRDKLAAGAARASGERARRTRTPLITVPPPDGVHATGEAIPAVDASMTTVSALPTTEPATTVSATTTPGLVVSRTTLPPRAEVEAGALDPARHTEKHRPRPVPRPGPPSARAVAHSGTRAEPRAPLEPRRTGRGAAERGRLKAVPDVGADLVAAPRVPAGTTSGFVTPGLEDLVQAVVTALRTVVAATGIAPEEVERRVAGTLAFLRRRLTGDFLVDDFGFDEDFTTHAYLPVLRPLYKRWFRVEVRGIENIPAVGGGLVVANHSGTIAMDSLMTQLAVYDEHPAHRHLRMLGADLVFSTPVIGQLARKSGSTLAANPDAERLLSGGEVVGVWPEGFKGVGKPFSERYKLQRFGRGGFVAAAIRTGVPIIPCSIVGAEEIYPIIGNMKTLARLVGAPYAPVTPTWPLLGPLGLIPLPSKWIIEFGVPVDTDGLGSGAADDPMLVFDLTDQIRETIQQTLYSLLMQRRSVFF